MISMLPSEATLDVRLRIRRGRALGLPMDMLLPRVRPEPSEATLALGLPMDMLLPRVRPDSSEAMLDVRLRMRRGRALGLPMDALLVSEPGLPRPT